MGVGDWAGQDGVVSGGRDPPGVGEVGARVRSCQVNRAGQGAKPGETWGARDWTGKELGRNQKWPRNNKEYTLFGHF